MDREELADRAVGADRRDPHRQPVVGRRDEPDAAAVSAERDLLGGVWREVRADVDRLAAVRRDHHPVTDLVAAGSASQVTQRPSGESRPKIRPPDRR